MKVIILVTACDQHPKRIQNQINSFKNLNAPEGVEFIPVFIFGTGLPPHDCSPFESLIVNVKEEYTSLYKKLFAGYKELYSRDFDFICKIDDDTKINVERFDKNLVEGTDYVGRIFNGGGEWSAKITIDLDLLDIHHTIYNGADFVTTPFKFATGDCYFLSKKAVKYIIDQEEIIKTNEEKYDFKIREDGFFGYLLNNKDVIVKDINCITSLTTENKLQVTQNYFSIHPINEVLFSQLIGINADEQMKIIDNNKLLNLVKRKIYLNALESKIKQVIYEFLNDNTKTMGLG